MVGFVPFPKSQEPLFGRLSAVNLPFLRSRTASACPRPSSSRFCPSSGDLRHIAGLPKGGSGSSVIEIMRHAVDAASDGLLLSGAWSFWVLWGGLPRGGG